MEHNDEYWEAFNAGRAEVLDAQKVYGYRNYETAMVILYIDNDRESHEAALALAKSVVKHITRGEQQSFMAEGFERQFDSMREKFASLPDPFETLLSGALASVEWYEVAAHYITKAEEANENGD